MAACLVELLGEKLQGSSGEVATVDALVGKKAIALYFSAHWCPPCRGFTPKFAKWYEENLKSKGLEVVFVSSDGDDESFGEYFGGMPWLALPYSERELQLTLSKKFSVSGIPAVIILGEDGKVITKDGRSVISSDPTGDDFPWTPKTLQEILAEATLIGKDGPVDKSSVDGKVIGFYFSAHWCPPCRGFTPKLAEFYLKSLKDKGLEIVFVSSDNDEEAFKEYYGEQPWLALSYSDRKQKEQLSNLYGVSGIPSFVIVDKDGSTITKEGRSSVMSDPEGAEFPWHPKPVRDIAHGPGNLNNTAVVVALCEAAEVASKEAAEEAMTPLAQKYLQQAKEAGEEDPKISFMIGKASSGITVQLRKLMGLESLPPPVHEHPLEEVGSAGGQWGCDGCNSNGRADLKRYRCTKGCDFDYCEKCNAEAGKDSVVPVRLMCIDCSKECYYVGPDGDLTTEVVEKFVASVEAGSVEKKPLGG